ncbi:hypothetical protein H7F16_13415 [Gemmobacter straminiformis]|uniref:Uncharacterized protein n=1 Tax=Paragemmobacter straminiformis TaxID=2045119 RepID=A0A842IAT4_9RHOB|nr:hypothetical protein [Gemmobacter straminiformis]
MRTLELVSNPRSIRFAPRIGHLNPEFAEFEEARRAAAGPPVSRPRQSHRRLVVALVGMGLLAALVLGQGWGLA